MRPFTMIAAAIFLLMALVHIYRIAVGFPITIGATDIGPEISWAALIVTGVMTAGLFREARGNTPNHLILVADFDPANPNKILLTPKAHLPKGSKEHHFKFTLDDRTRKEVQFNSLVSSDGWSKCPPNPALPHDQIFWHRMHNGDDPRWAEFKNRNNNKPPMDVSYQWEFICNDPAITVEPFDPIISNGGRV